MTLGGEEGVKTLPCGKFPYIATLPVGGNAALTEMLRQEVLVERMGNATCTPSQAGSVRTGIEEMPLRDYVELWLGRALSKNPAENRYVFGEFGEQWAPLREAYRRPPCQSCKGDRAAVTLGLGGLHSGAPWHFHNAAFIELIHGAKHVALLPPNDPVIPEVNQGIQGLSQYHWHQERRPYLERRGRLGNLQECILVPGEVLYFPNNWHHGIVNMEAYTAFVSTFVEQDGDDVTTTAFVPFA